MKTLSFNFLPLTLIVLISFSSGINANGEKIFSEDEVHKNVLKYIETVFDKDAPTLDIYYKYEKGEDEYRLEVKECGKKCGVSTTGQNRQVADRECIRKCIENKARNQSKVKSLYYSLIRQKLKFTPEDVLIKTILKPEKSYPFFRIIAKIKESDSIIVFWHAQNPKYMDFGFIGIYKVNGQDTREFLQITVTKEYPSPEDLRRRFLKGSN